MPKWRNSAGDRVRIAVGSFKGIWSPLVPVEPFTVLDVHLRREISIDVLRGHNALIYVLDGAIIVRADGRKGPVSAEHAVALHGDGRATLDASEPTHLLVLSGAAIRDCLFSRMARSS